jgi:hypothetical protein
VSGVRITERVQVCVRATHWPTLAHTLSRSHRPLRVAHLYTLLATYTRTLIITHMRLHARKRTGRLVCASTSNSARFEIAVRSNLLGEIIGQAAYASAYVNFNGPTVAVRANVTGMTTTSSIWFSGASTLFHPESSFGGVGEVRIQGGIVKVNTSQINLGWLRVQAGTAEIQDRIHVDNLWLSGGTLTAVDGGEVDVGTLYVTGGTFRTGDGTVWTVNSVFEYDAGSMYGPGEIVIPTEAEWKIDQVLHCTHRDSLVHYRSEC